MACSFASALPKYLTGYRKGKETLNPFQKQDFRTFFRPGQPSHPSVLWAVAAEGLPGSHFEKEMYLRMDHVSPCLLCAFFCNSTTFSRDVRRVR